jgi:hypothetical protein
MQAEKYHYLLSVNWRLMNLVVYIPFCMRTRSSKAGPIYQLNSSGNFNSNFSAFLFYSVPPQIKRCPLPLRC